MRDNGCARALLLSRAALAPHARSPVGWADVREILKAFVMTHAEKLACVSDPAGWDAALDAVAADFVQRKLVNVTGDDGQLVHSLSSDMSLLSAVTEGFLSTGGCERTLTPRSGGYGPSAGSNGAPSGPPGRRGGVVHRLALFKHGTISSILSQSDCMGYLAQHASLLGPLASASLASLGFVTGREVVCVAPETPTHAAFATMFASHVSAVGVTGPDGTMVANLSASDLRRLQPNNFRVLALPVSDFLASLAAGHSAGSAISLAKAAAAGAVGGANAPVTVSPDSPFLGVLELLGSQKPRVHRVYLCEKGVPVGVITATDVLRMLADKEAGRDTAVP